jgi:hypothetical protein
MPMFVSETSLVVCARRQYEGVMTKGYASNGVDAAVMGNIVAAGYGK